MSWSGSAPLYLGISTVPARLKTVDSGDSRDVAGLWVQVMKNTRLLKPKGLRWT